MSFASDEQVRNIIEGQVDYCYMSEQCCGEGIILNNIHTYDVFNDHDYIDVSDQNVVITDSYKHNLGNSYSKTTGDRSVNRMLAKLYDVSGRQSHLLWNNMSLNHSNLSDCNYDDKNVGNIRTVSLIFLNKSIFHGNRWVDIVYIQDTEMEVEGYHELVCLFVYLGFYVAFNTVQVISRRVVGRAEETSTYSSLGFCTVNCRPTAITSW